MLESWSMFKMNSKAALQKTIVLLTSSIQISSDSQCSQTDNRFWINPKCASQRLARNQISIMNQKVAFSSFHMGNVSVMDVWFYLLFYCTSQAGSCNLWAELNTISSRDLFCTCLRLLASMSRCCALFSSGLSVYHCVSGSVTVSLCLASNTLTLSFYPKSKLSI